jgi:hypothetical protein
MRLILAFFKWVVISLFEKLRTAHHNLAYSLEHNTGETLFFWMLMAMVATMVNLLLAGAVVFITDTKLSAGWIFVFALTMLVHLVYTGISVMFKCFKRDRAELFEKIKNGK